MNQEKKDLLNGQIAKTYEVVVVLGNDGAREINFLDSVSSNLKELTLSV